jgi:amidase
VRIEFRFVWNYALIVLTAIYGFCLASPVLAQSANRFDVVEATIDGIHAAMRSGGLSCTQLVQTYLDRIAAYDQAGPKLNAVQNVNPRALQQAADLDAKFKASGGMAPLHCIPVLLKDQVETDFMPTTYGSAMFKTFVPKRNGTVVDRLLRADAIILAKTNLGEFAAGGSGSAFGDCHNAYDPAYISPAGRPAAPASAWRRAWARSGSARTPEVRYVDRRRMEASSACARRPRW